ncbi:MAG TPA: hypothetical protein EYQ50_04850 [Verrucomicrobiales bacterium]|nr:hypothetical protein [Verrucomicrobiales bacterium]HIL69812.1 hypothetical protein [Verrucomicrobiota bacterium]
MKSSLSIIARILESLGKIITSFIWLAIIAFVLATVGGYSLPDSLLNFSFFSKNEPETGYEVKTHAPIAKVIPWHEVDQSIAQAIQSANKGAENLATAQLDLWTREMMHRVDDDFLNWYFSYWNQQVFGLKSLFHQTLHFVSPTHPSSAEIITQEVQEEFSKRVLRPQLAQLELENIVRKVMNRYVVNLRETLDGIPLEYEIARPQWERHLNDIAVLSTNSDGTRDVALTLKALYVSGAGGAVVLAGKTKSIITKIGNGVATATAGSAAAKLATRTGGKVAARTGGNYWDPLSVSE